MTRAHFARDDAFDALTRSHLPFVAKRTNHETKRTIMKTETERSRHLRLVRGFPVPFRD